MSHLDDAAGYLVGAHSFGFSAGPPLVLSSGAIKDALDALGCTNVEELTEPITGTLHLTMPAPTPDSRSLMDRLLDFMPLVPPRPSVDDLRARRGERVLRMTVDDMVADLRSALR